MRCLPAVAAAAAAAGALCPRASLALLLQSSDGPQEDDRESLAQVLRRAEALPEDDQALHSFRVRLRLQAKKKILWMKNELVVVPSIYERWSSFREEWDRKARQPKPLPRSIFLYQRFWEDEPFYLPNHGYEGAVYLRFIVDHYDNLPAVMLFIQDDYKFGGEEDCLRRDNLTYRDFHHQWIPERPLWTWRNRGNGPQVEQCWRDFGRIFELDLQPQAELFVSFFSCNNFAVGREQVRRRPLSQWKAAYAKAIAPRCHEGSLDLGEMSELSLSSAGLKRTDVVYDKADSTKDTSGGALEHLASMIYGFYPIDGPEPNLEAANCNDFLPQTACAVSPCTS